MVLMLARHKVIDAEKFIAGYTSADALALRAQYGVIDDSVWATIENNNDVLVIHYFDTEDQANSFLTADELKIAMEAFGVSEAPKIQLFNQL